MLADYHIHTKLCGHAEGEAEEYVESAIAKGLDEMGFSDHFPLFHVEPRDLSMGMGDMPLYINKVREMREKYKGRIKIKLGIEVEYTPEIEERTKQYLKDFGFDYILGSTHFIGAWTFDHPAQKEEWEKRDTFGVYKEYFSQLCKMIGSGLFDVAAHPDLVKKFGHRPKEKLTGIYLKVAKLLREKNMCLEINTSGLRRPVAEIYPAEELVKICFDNNVPVTLGSDAHIPADVGRDFDKAIALVKKAGYKKIAVFSSRRRSLVNL